MKLKELIPGTVVENSVKRIEYLGTFRDKYFVKIISSEFSWEKPGDIDEHFSGSYDGWQIVNMPNNSEEKSIENFKKRIEETKTELVRLENTLKGLEDSKRMKELTETLSNLIVGDFYTVKVGDNVFSGLYSGWSTNKNLIIFDMVGDRNKYVTSCLVKDIKQIIHRPNFSNEYRNLQKKIDTLNSELENV